MLIDIEKPKQEHMVINSKKLIHKKQKLMKTNL